MDNFTRMNNAIFALLASCNWHGFIEISVQESFKVDKYDIFLDDCLCGLDSIWRFLPLCCVISFFIRSCAVFKLSFLS